MRLALVAYQKLSHERRIWVSSKQEKARTLKTENNGFGKVRANLTAIFNKRSSKILKWIGNW